MTPYTSFYKEPGGPFNYCCGIFLASGIATATANRETGELHSEAGATDVSDPGIVYGGFGAVAHAVFGDTLYMTSSNADTIVTFSIHIDGELTSIANALLYVSVGDAAFGGLYPQDGGFSTASISANVSGSTQAYRWELDDPAGQMSIDETLQASFSFTGPMATVPVYFQLSTQGSLGLANFSNTATITLDALPNGVSFTSASGDFLADSGAIPEPSTWVIMLVGFSGLGVLARRRDLSPQPV